MPDLPEDPHKYGPSQMTEKSAIKGYEKYMEPVYQLPESLVQRAQDYLLEKMQSVWGAIPEPVLSYEEAVALCDMKKSPGYPWYRDCEDKGTALLKYGDKIKEQCLAILRGEEIECVFAGTLKSEMRLLNKLARVFNASPIHHLIPSKMLYHKQNMRLMETIGTGLHPITIGVRLPGNEFVRLLLSLKPRAWDGDGDGHDGRFRLRIARVIRDVRHSFLPGWTKPCGRHLYNSVFAGLIAMLGAVWRCYHQKSGQENTSTDNSLGAWVEHVIGIWLINPSANPDEVMKALFNGDDTAVSLEAPFTYPEMCSRLAKYNIRYSVETLIPRSPRDVIFLSHHIRLRFIPGLGDVMVTAGNLPKLLSSLDRKSVV